MHLGVPFIAPRQLGAVESNLGRLILPSVDWHTGQSGAHRTCPVPDFFPYVAQSTVGCQRAVGAPDSPVPPSSRWLSHVSRADRVADRWPGRPLAHRTVRCTPDSPVNYSRTSSVNARERPLRSNHPGAPDTVRCTTGQSGAPRLSRFLAPRAKTISIGFFLFPALRHNTLVHKTMY
jgi:hypothetical protein